MASASDFIDKLGLTPMQAQALGDSGFDLTLTDTSLKFCKGGEVLHSIPIPGGTVGKIMGGDASPLTVKAVKDTLMKKVTALSPADSPLHQKLSKPVETPSSKALASPKSVTKSVPTPTQAVTICETYPLSELTSGHAVSLTSAEKLYQPVKGSDSGSRYFLVARADGLNVAVRWKHSKMSLRVEGPGLPSWAPHLSAAGINVHGPYASLHVTVDGDIQARKVVGALLACIPAQWMTPLPMLDFLKNQGK